MQASRGKSLCLPTSHFQTLKAQEDYRLIDNELFATWFHLHFALWVKGLAQYMITSKTKQKKPLKVKIKLLLTPTGFWESLILHDGQTWALQAIYIDGFLSGKPLAS